MEAFTLCLTGPGGAWKSALAREVEGALLERGVEVKVLDREPEIGEPRPEGGVLIISTPLLTPAFVEDASAGGRRLLEVRCEEGGEDVERCAARILDALEAQGCFAAPAAPEYSPEEEKRIAERLADLGYLE